MECFRILSNEIEGRIDPHAYHPKRMNEIHRVKSLNFQILPLKNIVDFRRKIVTSNDQNLTYVGLENIESNTGIFIPSDNDRESFGSAFIFKKGDILFPKLRPYLNKVYFADFDGICSTEFHVLQAKKCNNLYLFSFLSSNIVVNQTSFLMTGNVLPRLQTADIENLLVPIPLPEIQEKIISTVANAYQIKTKKDNEARQLLDSIDDFVLNELNCAVQSSNKFCFIIHLNEIKDRLDPLYYSKDIFSFMNTSPYKQMKIEEITSYLKTGFAAGAQDQEEANGILQIRPTNINDERLLCFDKNVYVKSELLPKRRSSLVRKKEILFNNTNSQELIGKTAFFDLDGNFFCSNHITRIKVKESIISPEYLWVILNLYQRNKIFFNICTNWNNQSGVNVELLKSLNILVPPLEVQKTITDEVKFRIEKAELLQQEAQQILEKAKLEVEEILLRS